MRYSDLQVQHHYAMIGDTQFHYVEAGKGPLVLLLHGFPEMWWCWRYQIQALAQAGFRVVAPDLRGYGGTEKKGPYDLETLSSDIQGLIDALGETKAHIVGHDWGGAIAWHFAATHPDSCRKLTVLNCPHPKMFARAFRKSATQLRRSWYIFAFQLPFLPELALTRTRGHVMRAMYRSSVVDPAHFGNEELAPILQAMQAPGAAHAAIGYYRAAVRGLVVSRGKNARLPKITVPSLLIWGKNDVALDYDSVVPGTQKHVEKLEIQLIENCGHFVQEEQPEAVNQALLKFLTQD